MEVVQIAKKEKHVEHFDIEPEKIREHAVEIEKKLMGDVKELKKYFTETFSHLDVEVKDTKIGVDVNDKHQIEVDLGLRVLLKGKK